MKVLSVLKNRDVSVLFQPIKDVLNGRILGYEALVRGPQGELYSPLDLLEAARQHGRLKQMELLCINKALEVCESLPGDLVFLNVSPLTLISYYKAIEQNIINCKSKVVLELTEVGLGKTEHLELVSVLSYLKKRGIKIALDDIGAGDRNLISLCELPLDYIKLDRTLVHGLANSFNGSTGVYRTVVKAVVDISREINAQVIAEGVETIVQLGALREVGINLVQGFLFSKPLPVEEWIYNRKVSVSLK